MGLNLSGLNLSELSLSLIKKIDCMAMINGIDGEEEDDDDVLISDRQKAARDETIKEEREI